MVASVLVCGLLLAILPRPSKGENLLADGGFEAPADDGSKWSPIWSRTPNAGKAALDADSFHSGRQSLRITHGGELDWSVSQVKPTPVTPGDIMVISAWVKSQDTAQAQIGVITRAADGQVREWIYGAADTSGKHDWRLLTRRFVVPPDVTSVQFRITGAGKALLWVDEAGLEKQGSIMDSAKPLEGKTFELNNQQLRIVLDAATACLSVTDKRNGHTWRQEVRAGHDLVVKGARQQDGAILLDLWDVGGDMELGARLTLDPSRPKLDVSLNGQGPMLRNLPFPRPFVTDAGTWLVVPMNEGIIFPVDDATVGTMRLVTYGGHGICMPWFGVTDPASGAGVMAIIQTADDAQIAIDRDGGDGKLLYIQPAWDPSRRAFGYERRISYTVLDSGGYVAMAQQYREYARQTGLLKTLAEKRKKIESVDLLVGSANIWNWDMNKVDLCRQMKDLGMGRILWSGAGEPEELRQINQMGFLSSRYDIYQDLMDPAQFPNLQWTHPDWTTAGWPDDLTRRANGDWERGWEVEAKEGKAMIPCGVLCDRVAPPYARERIGKELATHPYHCRFIDTTTAAPWRECYDPRHPMTRTESREWKMKLLALVGDEFGLVTGSETGHDAAVPYVHYFEGMLSLGPYRLPDSGRAMLEYKAPTPEFLKYQVGPFYRVPLWELVYHDCVVSTWYWGDYNNKAPEVWPQRDLFNLLYGTSPMYMFTGQTWERDKALFAESYKRVCPVVRQVGYDQMLSHEFISADHTVQRTVFSGGTEIVVNFGKSAHVLADGRVVGPMSHAVVRR
jgi:hypothetical protein